MNESRGFSALMRLIRPKQWIKNGFVFVPLFFGGALFHTDALLAGVITFFAYSFAASSIYCFNDIFDAEADRRHPVKCHRPIASGAVSVKAAYCLMILMLILSIVISAALDSWKAMGIILFYWLLNLCYCAKLKQYAIIDVCIVAFGFVLRLLAGGVATDIALSKWIVLMTFLITLFMSFAKRRDDVLRMEKTGEAPQPYLHQPGHHHHCLGNACVLHHVHGKSGGDRAFQHRASLSHKCLRAGGIAALHTDSCGRPTER